MTILNCVRIDAGMNYTTMYGAVHNERHVSKKVLSAAENGLKKGFGLGYRVSRWEGVLKEEGTFAHIHLMKLALS